MSKAPKSRSSTEAKSTVSSAFASVRYALDRFQDAPPHLRGLVIILAIVAFVTLAFGTGLYLKGQQDYVFFCFIIFAAVSVVVLILFFRIAFPQESIQQKGATQPSEQVNLAWDRLVLEYPIHGDALDALHTNLENLRNEVFACISRYNSKLALDCLRANIFLPNYTQAGDGYVCWLEMLEKLQINMNNHPDVHIKFRPGQGATGKVFVEEKPHIAQIFEMDDGRRDWQDFYQLTPQQKKEIHPELRWIVSVPLTVPDSQKGVPKTVGVLSVDGLNTVLDRNCLNEVSALLTTKVPMTVGPTLSHLRKVRLVVGVKEGL